jgi:predicted NBD/HSP70 family sugar kinase
MTQLIFDMGGTKTRIALVKDGHMGEVLRMDTDRGGGGFGRFLGALEELAAGQQIQGIAGGMPGQLEGDHGELTWAPNLKAWLGVPVRARLQERFHCPVRIENDVVLGGVGESHSGAGLTEGVMAYFTVSTGINGVRIVDGEPDETIERYEIGQQLLMDEQGEVTTLESRVGGAAMEQRHGKPPKEVRDPKVWQGVAHDLAVGLYNTLLHWTPEVVVFGGSMMRDIDLVTVRRELEALPAVMPELPRLEHAKLQDLQGLMGAMALLKGSQGR